MTYTIRPMTREDLGQVNKIDIEAFPTQWPPANYRQELENRLAHYIVVMDDSQMVEAPAPKPAGSLSRLFSRLRSRSQAPTPAPPPVKLIIGFSGIWLMADEAHITNIAVRRHYQGKGFGELLLIATFDLSRELKASVMTLEVRRSNTVAQNLYLKYGFTETGLRKGYYLDNREDAIIMATPRITAPDFRARLEALRQALAERLNHA